MKNNYDEYELKNGAINVATFLSGVVVGGLAGAAVMLFMAPASGEETRHQLREKSLELRDRVIDSAEEARARVGEVASQARDKAQELSEGARAKLERR